MLIQVKFLFCGLKQSGAAANPVSHTLKTCFASRIKLQMQQYICENVSLPLNTSRLIKLKFLKVSSIQIYTCCDHKYQRRTESNGEEILSASRGYLSAVVCDSVDGLNVWGVSVF